LGKVNKPVDRSEWGMSPQTVNAYYDPTKNLIAFPAAILQVNCHENQISVSVSMKSFSPATTMRRIVCSCGSCFDNEFSKSITNAVAVV
jgi:hypothetical protein